MRSTIVWLRTMPAETRCLASQEPPSSPGLVATNQFMTGIDTEYSLPCATLIPVILDNKYFVTILILSIPSYCHFLALPKK